MSKVILAIVKQWTCLSWICLICVCMLFPPPIFGQNALKQDLFSVSFPTESHGWACGRWGRVVHTNDSGNQWRILDTGTDYTLSSICFVDAMHGWAVGDVGTILYTSDGGKTWERQKSPVDYFHMGVFFIDKKRGWIASERTHILYTDNGGKSWQVQHSDQDFILKGISFSDPENGWAVGEYGYIYHTGNGGETWARQCGGFGFCEDTGDIIGGNFLYDVQAISPAVAWAVGMNGYVIRTTNCGKTWEEVKSELTQKHLFGVSADKSGTVIIGGSGNLWATKDNGKTFANIDVRPSIEYGWIYGISSRNNIGFAAVGKNGSIYMGDRIAETWKRRDQ